MNSILSFATKDEALDWLARQEDEQGLEYMDNERFAFKDNEQEMQEYENKKNSGCCGFLDEDIIVNGREAVIGCNFGH